MMEENVLEISAKQLIQFCSTISTTKMCPITIDYCKKFGTKGKYASIVKNFIRNESGIESIENDDEMFYKILTELDKENNYIYTFDFGDGTSVQVKYNEFYIDDSNVIDQKWHWLISVFAYLDIVNNKFFIESDDYPIQFRNSPVNKQGRINFEEKFKVADQIKWKVAVTRNNKPICYGYEAMKLWLTEASGIDVSFVKGHIDKNDYRGAKEAINNTIKYSDVCQKVIESLEK